MTLLEFMTQLLAVKVLPDGGQVYAETDLDRFIVEPWNAVSSLFILLPAVYWGVKLRGQYKEYPFIAFCIPLLFLGGLGSTLFHAFRSSRLLLLLDVTPTAILTVALAIYFWIKVLPKWWIAILIVAISAVLRVVATRYLPGHSGINVAYGIGGAVLFIPTLILLYQTKMAHSFHLLTSLACFLLAIGFRQTDKIEQNILPMGTHFLWHIFTGIGGFFLAEYLYKLHLKEKEVEILD